MPIYTIPDIEVIDLATKWVMSATIIRKKAREAAEAVEHRRLRIARLDPAATSEVGVVRWFGRKIASVRAKLDSRAQDSSFKAQMAVGVSTSLLFDLEGKTASLANAAEERGIDTAPLASLVKALAVQERSPSGQLYAFEENGEAAFKVVEELAELCGGRHPMSSFPPAVVARTETPPRAAPTAKPAPQDLPLGFLQGEGKAADPWKCVIPASDIRHASFRWRDDALRQYPTYSKMIRSFDEQIRDWLKSNQKRIYGVLPIAELDAKINEAIVEGKDFGESGLKSYVEGRKAVVAAQEGNRSLINTCLKNLSIGAKERGLSTLPLEVVASCDFVAAKCERAVEASNHLIERLIQLAAEEEAERLRRITEPDATVATSPGVEPMVEPMTTIKPIVSQNGSSTHQSPNRRNAIERAWAAFQCAVDRNPDLAEPSTPDRAIWEWIDKHGVEGYRLPAFETFTNYLSKARGLNALQKNSSYRPSQNGKSVVRQADIESEERPD